MSIRKLSHVGIAVRSLQAQLPFYQDVLGLRLLATEEIPDQRVRVAILQLGESTLELLEPTDEKSPVARFLERHGEGIHHLAYDVEGLDAQLRHVAGQGVRLIDREPRAGAHGKRIAFLHPASTGGVLTELCE